MSLGDPISTATRACGLHTRPCCNIWSNKFEKFSYKLSWRSSLTSRNNIQEDNLIVPVIEISLFTLQCRNLLLTIEQTFAFSATHAKFFFRFSIASDVTSFSSLYTCLSFIRRLSPDGHNLQESLSITSAKTISPEKVKCNGQATLSEKRTREPRCFIGILIFPIYLPHQVKAKSLFK